MILSGGETVPVSSATGRWEAQVEPLPRPLLLRIIKELLKAGQYEVPVDLVAEKMLSRPAPPPPRMYR